MDKVKDTMPDTKRTYQVIFDYIANGNYTEYTRDRRIVDAESPQAAVDLVKANRGDLVGYEACNVLEIAEGWCVRQGKVVAK